MKKIARRSFLASATAFGFATPTQLHSVVANQRNPDAEAIECLLNDDTACAVSVWETEFENNRLSDITRQNYFYSLLIHGLRSLDKGQLSDAKDAYKTAVTILPSSDAIGLSYLADATSSYNSLIQVDPMELYRNQPQRVEPGWEGQYVSETGWVGATTTAFALTAKETGRFNYFYSTLRDEPKVAYRINFKRLSNAGYLILHLGKLPNGTPVFFDLSFYTNWRAAWTVFSSSSENVEVLNQGNEVGVDIEGWHAIEARFKQNTVEIWLDYYYLVTFSVHNLDFSELGYGAGLHEDSTAMTFTIIFDDESIYRLR